MDKNDNYDVVIIGGGIIGLSAAYYAAASGKKTLLIEAKDLFHDYGGSGGESRFFRMIYSNRGMAQLAETSYALWQQIESYSGLELIKKTPVLFFGDKNIGETVEGDFATADSVMDSLGMPYQKLNSSQLLKTIPAFKAVPRSFSGLMQENSGYIKVQNALKAFYDLASRHGAKFLKEKVVSIESKKNKKNNFIIKTETQKIVSKKIILALGAWTNELTHTLGVTFNLKIWQMTIGYYKILSKKYEYPLWYEFGVSKKKHQNLFYGFPEYEQPGFLKVSADFTNHQYDHVSQCTRVPDESLLKLIGKHVSQRFKFVAPEAEFKKTCLYAMSADYTIILGLLPSSKHISILTGESGRAFKYAPLFGRILNELVFNGHTEYNIDCFSIYRNKLLARSR